MSPRTGLKAEPRPTRPSPAPEARRRTAGFTPISRHRDAPVSTDAPRIPAPLHMLAAAAVRGGRFVRTHPATAPACLAALAGGALGCGLLQWTLRLGGDPAVTLAGRLACVVALGLAWAISHRFRVSPTVAGPAFAAAVAAGPALGRAGGGDPLRRVDRVRSIGRRRGRQRRPGRLRRGAAGEPGGIAGGRSTHRRRGRGGGLRVAASPRGSGCRTPRSLAPRGPSPRRRSVSTNLATPRPGRASASRRPFKSSHLLPAAVALGCGGIAAAGLRTAGVYFPLSADVLVGRSAFGAVAVGVGVLIAARVRRDRRAAVGGLVAAGGAVVAAAGGPAWVELNLWANATLSSPALLTDLRDPRRRRLPGAGLRRRRRRRPHGRWVRGGRRRGVRRGNLRRRTVADPRPGRRDLRRRRGLRRRGDGRGAGGGDHGGRAAPDAAGRRRERARGVRVRVRGRPGDRPAGAVQRAADARPAGRRDRPDARRTGRRAADRRRRDRPRRRHPLAGTGGAADRPPCRPAGLRRLGSSRSGPAGLRRGDAGGVAALLGGIAPPRAAARHAGAGDAFRRHPVPGAGGRRLRRPARRRRRRPRRPRRPAGRRPVLRRTRDPSPAGRPAGGPLRRPARRRRGGRRVRRDPLRPGPPRRRGGRRRDDRGVRRPRRGAS